MKRLIIKKFITYCIIGLALNIISYVLHPNIVLINIIRLLALFAVLFDIGITIKNKNARKKYVIYSSVLFGQGIILWLVSLLLNVGLENTWLAFIGVNIMFLTILVSLFDTAQTIHKTYKKIARFLYFIASLGILILVITSVLTCLIKV